MDTEKSTETPAPAKVQHPSLPSTKPSPNLPVGQQSVLVSATYKCTTDLPTADGSIPPLVQTDF